MNKILVKVYVPQLEKKYDIWIPINKTVYTIISSITKGINSLNKVSLEEGYIMKLYNKANSEIYDLEKKIIDTDIRNGTELIMI